MLSNWVLYYCCQVYLDSGLNSNIPHSSPEYESGVFDGLSDSAIVAAFSSGLVDLYVIAFMSGL